MASPNKNNFNLDYIGQVPPIAAQKTFYAGPVSGADTTPVFRTIALTDLPAGNNNFNNLDTYGPLYATSATSVTTLNPSGSTTGNPLVSGGTGSAPFYTSQPVLYRLTYNNTASYVIDGDGGTGGTYGSLLLKGVNASGLSGALFLGNSNHAIYGAVGTSRGTTGSNLNMYTSGSLLNYFGSEYQLYRNAVLAFMVGDGGKLGINYAVQVGEVPWLTINTAASNQVGLRITGSGTSTGSGLELVNTTGTTYQMYTNSSSELVLTKSGAGTPLLKSNANNALAVDGSYGTNGQLLMSTGTGGAPQWTTISNLPQTFQRLTLNNNTAFPALFLTGNFPARICFNNTTTPDPNYLTLSQTSNNWFKIGYELVSNGVVINGAQAIGYTNPSNVTTFGTAGQVFTTGGSSAPFSYRSLVTTPPVKITVLFDSASNGYITRDGTINGDWNIGYWREFIYGGFSRDSRINRIDFEGLSGGGGGACSEGAAFASDDAAGGGGGGGAYAMASLARGQGNMSGYRIAVGNGGDRGATGIGSYRTGGIGGRTFVVDSTVYSSTYWLFYLSGGGGGLAPSGLQTYNAGGSGGDYSTSAHGGPFVLRGANGQNGSQPQVLDNRYNGGNGGGSVLGQGGVMAYRVSDHTDGANGSGYGAGGGGAERQGTFYTDGNGGYSTSGVLFITEYYDVTLV